MVPAELEPGLRRLVTLFLEENAKVNLSAFRTAEQCWTGNVLDALAALDVTHVTAAKTIMDLGTGGGFPLLPLAVALPNASFTGLDSVRKKVEAVGRIAHALHLENVNVITGRAEELGRRGEYRERFDLVTSRAVAAVNVLLEYASPFVKPRGHIVLWKSMNVEQELRDSLLARAELSAHLVAQHVYELPDSWGKRQLLIFQKGAPLSDAYPRDVGVPAKKPLL